MPGVGPDCEGGAGARNLFAFDVTRFPKSPVDVVQDARRVL